MKKSAGCLEGRPPSRVYVVVHSMRPHQLDKRGKQVCPGSGGLSSRSRLIKKAVGRARQEGESAW